MTDKEAAVLARLQRGEAPVLKHGYWCLGADPVSPEVRVLAREGYVKIEIGDAGMVVNLTDKGKPPEPKRRPRWFQPFPPEEVVYIRIPMRQINGRWEISTNKEIET